MEKEEKSGGNTVTRQDTSFYMTIMYRVRFLVGGENL